jgi:FkbM family methyltransferase
MNKVITATAITNHKYRVFTQDYAGSRLLVTGIWEPFVTMTIERILRPGDIFVDVGANFGYYSILASNLVQGSGKVIAFECNPNVAVLIKENIQLNNCKNIMLYEHALGDQEGNINFFLSSTDTGHGSLDRGENSKEISVQIHKFDDINLKLSIRLIKIDVEGAEFRVLKGMNKLLSSTSKPYVICEMSNKFNDRGGDSSKDILEYMHSFGYKAKFIPLSQSPYPPFESLSVEFEEATLEKILDSKDMRDILFVPIVNN